MPCKIPRIAPSLGGVESLIEQPLVMSYYQCTPEDRRAYGIPDNMIRLSCGIENPDDLIADLGAGTRFDGLDATEIAHVDLVRHWHARGHRHRLARSASSRVGSRSARPHVDRRWRAFSAPHCQK